MATKLPTPPKVGMVSLGCPKALVDSERILTKLRADGYQMSPDYAGADVVLVNTCGFLDSAKEESLEAIGEAIAENGRVVVTGCMGNEAEVIRARFPDVLAVTGPQQYEAVVSAVQQVTGVTPNLSTGGGTSDGRFIAPSGAQIVELGVMNATIHKVDEHVRVEDIERLKEIYLQVLKNLLA